MEINFSYASIVSICKFNSSEESAEYTFIKLASSIEDLFSRMRIGRKTVKEFTRSKISNQVYQTSA